MASRSLTIVRVLLALSCVLALAAAKTTTDPKHCEVCIKVMNDIDALIPADEKTSQTSIEEAIDRYCGQSTLGQKERKLCYYIEPIKRSVSHPFTLRMPKDRLCKRITKDNDDICNVKYPVKMDAAASQEDVGKLRVKQLKGILNDRGE